MFDFQEFEQEPGINDWTRFYTYYCSRVHRLTVDRYEFIQDFRSLDPMFEYVLRNLPAARPLLPNLEEFRYRRGMLGDVGFGAPENLFIFLHGLRRFSISLSQTDANTNVPFLKVLPFQSTNLTHLEFSCTKPGYEGILKECLEGLPNLDTATLPSIPDGSPILTRLKHLGLGSFDDDGKLVLPSLMTYPLQPGYEGILKECLEGLPNLDTATLPSIPDGSPILTRLKHLGLGSFDDDGKLVLPSLMTYPLQPGTLCRLESLHLCVHYSLATASLLAQSDLLQDLKSVIICSNLVESPDAVKQLSSAIAKTCPNVEKVHIVCNATPRTLSGSVVLLSHIQPLYQCGQIKDLKFTHLNALGSVSSVQLNSLIKSFPNLKSLILNPDGSGTEDDNFNLAVLATFAEAVPDIEHIGMRFYVSTLPSDQSIHTQGHILRNLRTLDVDRSRLKNGDMIRTAFFLSGIVPRECRILSQDPGWNNMKNLLLPQVMAAALDKSESSLKAIEEKLNKSLSSAVLWSS
ncbi:hypothetical protein K435DRAFT_842119 [Dendrothele bispora CBS 962.96]|uniref:RNI-like protein n=1 Tax=Dendrothele bispora (strain CBS 962.96) TaxID=1314807 RepID=A0A4S8LID4_DENBC|nr:hypothetical protein K435DRAFT_842119 [Dendrothele bispora CBS 962.96]